MTNAEYLLALEVAAEAHRAAVIARRKSIAYVQQDELKRQYYAASRNMELQQEIAPKLAEVSAQVAQENALVESTQRALLAVVTAGWKN